MADKKILSELAKIKKQTGKNIENFEFSSALHELYEFFWHEFCDKYMSHATISDVNAAYAYGVASLMTHVLKACGDDLSRDNILAQAASIKDLQLPLLLTGLKINTSPENYSPIRQMQLANFDGDSWQLFGDLITA